MLLVQRSMKADVTPVGNVKVSPYAPGLRFPNVVLPCASVDCFLFRLGSPVSVKATLALTFGQSTAGLADLAKTL